MGDIADLDTSRTGSRSFGKLVGAEKLTSEIAVHSPAKSGRTTAAQPTTRHRPESNRPWGNRSRMKASGIVPTSIETMKTHAAHAVPATWGDRVKP
jgi:hypothetical protein